MEKANLTVLKETKYIAINIVVMSILMQIVFFFLHKWDITVLTGNILSAAAMVANFYFLGTSLQKALEKDEAEAKKIMKLSKNLRTLFLFVIIVIGVSLPFFNTVSVIIPVFFTRIAIALKSIFLKFEGKGGEKQ